MSKSTYRIKLVRSNGSDVTDAYVRLYCHGSGGWSSSEQASWGEVVINTVGYGKADVYLTRHGHEQLVGQVPGAGAYKITVLERCDFLDRERLGAMRFLRFLEGKGGAVYSRRANLELL